MGTHVTIYHNPRCGKSRHTLELLKAHGVEPKVVEYLRTPPDVATLGALLRLLGLAPRQLLRVHETAYAEAGLNEASTDEAIIEAMVNYPILIERPIVVVDNRKAAVGRPPESILKIL